MTSANFSRRAALGLLAAGPVALAGVVAQSQAAEQPTAGKILMPLGDATEAVDTLYPYFRVQEDGYQAVVAGPEARLYHMVLHEIPPDASVPWDITQERPGYHIKADIAFRDVKPEEYAGLFVSGGRCAGIPPLRQGPAADHAPLFPGQQAGRRGLPRHRDSQRSRRDPRPQGDHRGQMRPGLRAGRRRNTSTSRSSSTATSSPPALGTTGPLHAPVHEDAQGHPHQVGVGNFQQGSHPQIAQMRATESP